MVYRFRAAGEYLKLVSSEKGRFRSGDRSRMRSHYRNALPQGRSCDFRGLSKHQADINYARNRDKENLTIMVGNLNDMTFPEKFDYVVVNGVLEYAMSLPREKVLTTFLQHIGRLSEAGGKL